ncbi:ATP-binding protein [Alteromonas sp. ASW11-19]|uniref:histidine kinase n=1 Tax=Alteromonas salexigens TaxID=2982530 RepID=A0ABT2VMZ8_9ALTE|nr:ATP-binding protein [Alteromonas salexigens]MCU7554475.1 ATP-binding protein [Alteromonas salexigens]
MKLIRALREISADITLSSADKMTRLLRLGCEAFGQDIGLVSHIYGDTYEVVAAVSPEDAIAPGDTFPLGDTFCNDTLATDGITAYHNVSKYPGGHHPACKSFQLYSYIGIPVIVDRKRYGTLNFSSPEPAELAFTDEHYDYLMLLAEWVGMQLANQHSFELLMQHQNELEHQYQLFSHVCEMANVGTWEQNLSTGELRWSETMKRMHGLPADETMTSEKAGQFIVSATERKEVLALHEHALSTGSTWQKQVEVQLKDGTRKWMITYARPVVINNQHVSMIGATQDITGRVHDEHELRRRQQQAETALKARTEFLANMSHEIRTPIHGVLGMLDAIKRTPLGEKQREYCGLAWDSAQHLLAQVNDILDFSKIDAGLMTFEKVPVTLNDMIVKQVAVHQAKLKEKGLHLAVETRATEDIIFECDPLRINQVISNLVSNAVKFTQDGGISIATRATKQSDSHYLVQLTVVDTGIGIAEAEQQKIFLPFEQADTATTRVYGGTGLGLSIVKQIVKHYQGEVRVSSELGQGATFTVTLQLPLASLPDTTEPRTAAKKQTGNSLKGKTILVAEDNPINQLVIKEQLQELGVSFTITDNGQQAVDTLAAANRSGSPFDLVIMDCQMPVLDGYKAAQSIRALAGPESQTPIIALTAHALAGEKEKCQAAGMNDFLTKPATIDDLRTCLVTNIATYQMPHRGGV